VKGVRAFELVPHAVLEAEQVIPFETTSGEIVVMCFWDIADSARRSRVVERLAEFFPNADQLGFGGNPEATRADWERTIFQLSSGLSPSATASSGCAFCGATVRIQAHSKSGICESCIARLLPTVVVKQCDFCDHPRADGAEENGHRICGGCLELAKEILSSTKP
jgi:hypothetical protein